MGGHNNIQFRFNIPCEYPAIVVDAQYSIYYDETFIRSGTFSLSTCYNGNTFPYYNTSYSSPLITDYDFTLYIEDMCYNIGDDINLELGHGCTNAEIDTSSSTGDMVNLQIISGGQYTSFYGYQGMITDNLAVPFSELSRVRLKQDQFYSGSISNVIVEINLAGITKQASTRVHPKSSYGITVGYVPYAIKYDEIKYMEISPFGPGAHGHIAEFPSEVILNAEIIKGSELGYLEDFDTGQTGDTLYNILFQSFGGNHIGFVGSGVKADNIDTAIVRFRTSDAELNTVDVPVIITPGPLVVIVEPTTLLPGETATITIKNRLDDGTIIDFPPEQNFEVSMLDGCTLGNIFVGADSGNYFYDVPQPIIFKADANAEVGVVKLRVGLIEQIGIGRNVRGNDFTDKKVADKDQEKRQRVFKDKIEKMINEKRNNQPTATPENIESSCYFGEYQTYTEENVEVAVGGWCAELDECEEIEFPDIELKVYGNNWQNLNACQDPTFLAGTDFFPSDNSNYREDFEIELCKEENGDKLQFTFDDDIVINCVSDMCEANITPGQAFLINDVYSFPQNMPCSSKIKWLEHHKLYPMPTNTSTPLGQPLVTPVIRDIWMRHEEQHRVQFLKVAEGFKEEYLKKIKDEKKQCSDFSSEEDAMKHFKKRAEEIIKEFYTAVIKEDERISKGGDDGDDIMQFERRLHKIVIDDYLQDLIDYWKLSKCGTI